MNLLHDIRFGVRVLLSFLFSFTMYLVAAGCRLFHPKDQKKMFNALCNATSFWGYGVAWIWGMKIEVTGTKPRHPFYLISNHISYTDIVLLCAVSPAWFISKADVAGWPGIGALTRMALTVFIDRETRRDVARMNTLIGNLIAEGGSVGFFPEGTTSDGSTIQPFKPSLLQPAVELTFPVSLAVIAYQTPSGGLPPEELVAWYGDDELGPHARRLLGTRGFRARVYFDPDPVTGSDRKDIAQKAHSRMLDHQARLKGDLK